MKAVVLVGGFGTRLRPLTLHTPKQMLPMVGVPMIERVVTSLAACGVTDAILSLGDELGFRVQTSVQNVDLQLVAREVAGELYGIDVSSDHDYLALAERWRPVRAWATVLIRATAERSVTAS